MPYYIVVHSFPVLLLIAHTAGRRTARKQKRKMKGVKSETTAKGTIYNGLKGWRFLSHIETAFGA
jgi:hypothetical protein